VAQLDLLSTLFPHLSHDRVHDFRKAFAAGLICLTVLYLTGLIGAAILVATLLVPLLYLLYLYDARVCRNEARRVLILVGGGGAGLGALMALGANRALGVLPLLPEPSPKLLILLTILLPCLQEVIKPLPALLLRGRPAFAHTVDALTLGVAAGLGFALAQTLVTMVPMLIRLPFRIDPATWIYPLMGLGILLPVLQATCTGAVTASLWRGPQRRGLRFVHSGIAVALLAHIAFSLGTRLLLERGAGQIAALAWQALLVAAMIIYMRMALHRALLEETAVPSQDERPCANCRRNVLAGRFCPYCGMAMAASPRHLAAEPPVSAS